MPAPVLETSAHAAARIIEIVLERSFTHVLEMASARIPAFLRALTLDAIVGPIAVAVVAALVAIIAAIAVAVVHAVVAAIIAHDSAAVVIQVILVLARTHLLEMARARGPAFGRAIVLGIGRRRGPREQRNDQRQLCQGSICFCNKGRISTPAPPASPR